MAGGLCLSASPFVCRCMLYVLLSSAIGYDVIRPKATSKLGIFITSLLFQ